MTDLPTSLPHNEKIIALLNISASNYELISNCDFHGVKLLAFKNDTEIIFGWEQQKLNIVAIISETEIKVPIRIDTLENIKSKKLPDVPFFLLSGQINKNNIRICFALGVTDVFKLPLDKFHFEKRVNFMVTHWHDLKKQVDERKVFTYKTQLPKRIFDIFFSGLALLFLLPVLLIIVIIMKVESRGPIFYYSWRVGTGYKIFKFYKLRSMYVNADKKLKGLKHLNQYTTSENPIEKKTMNVLCDECAMVGKKCRFPLYSDNHTWCEKYDNSKKTTSGPAFFKLKDDPRITRIGKFLRNTSIDELPQLWNVFIGDMSIVGNRPLPLYEAEKLTTDKYAMRFLAPAGITGLWQVEKRGRGAMSEEERLMLDNTYAESHSFKNDILLILKTIPALLQKENV